MLSVLSSWRVSPAPTLRLSYLPPACAESGLEPKSASALPPASGTASGIQRPYERAIIVKSEWPICCASHTGDSPAVSIIEAYVWRVW
jgi:hypothetical protein